MSLRHRAASTAIADKGVEHNPKVACRITGHRNSKESAIKIHLGSHNSAFNQKFKFVVLCQSSPEKLLN